MVNLGERIETEEYKCPYCQKPVKTFWAFSTTKTSMCLGLKHDPSYVLAGDSVFHAVCWDKCTVSYFTCIGETNGTSTV